MGRTAHATIIKWFDDKGWGFAKPCQARPDVFVHRDQLLDPADVLRLGAKISCRIVELQRPRAINIRVL